MPAVTPMTETMEGLVAFVEACHCITTPREFALKVYPMLAALLPHQMFAAALVESEDRIDYCLNLHFPDGYLQRLISAEGTFRCPVFHEWRRTLRPVCFDLSNANADTFDPAWLQLARSHGVRSIAAHGVPSGASTRVSFFTFAGIEHQSPLCQLRLRLIVPALHAALVSASSGSVDIDPAREDAVAGTVAPTESSHMTKRELEVLRWISRGKSTDVTAAILGISPWTVKAHVKHILMKLEVTCRAQAVAKAFQLGLIT